jgi:hypothetical protein
MVRITHAVLHVFDTDTGSCLLSDRELDLGERTARTYVQRIVRKAVSSPENGTARLTEGHGIAHELMRYASGQRELSIFRRILRVCCGRACVPVKL